MWGEVGRRIPKWGGGRKWVRKDSIKIKTKKNINFKKRRRKEKETKLPGEGLEKKNLVGDLRLGWKKKFLGCVFLKNKYAETHAAVVFFLL